MQRLRIPFHLQVQCPVSVINGPTDTCVDSCSSCVLPSLHACLGRLLLISHLAGEQSQQQQQHCTSVPLRSLLRRLLLTALDVNSASGIVLSQLVLHHTRVIPRILQFRSADLDFGVFPVGDNTRTAESGESGQGGNSMERQQVETWGTERQTTGQAVAWQQRRSAWIGRHTETLSLGPIC